MHEHQYVNGRVQDFPSPATQALPSAYITFDSILHLAHLFSASHENPPVGDQPPEESPFLPIVPNFLNQHPLTCPSPLIVMNTHTEIFL